MTTTATRGAMVVMAIIATLFITTACSDQKQEDTRPAVEAVAGTYIGTTTVKINSTDLGQPAAQAKIKIEQSGQNVKLTLVESEYGDMLQGAVIAVDDVVVTGDKGNYSLSGSAEVTVGKLSVPVTISGGGPVSKMVIKIGVKMTDLMAMELTFTGVKQ